jgi:hypothetical protein
MKVLMADADRRLRPAWRRGRPGPAVPGASLRRRRSSAGCASGRPRPDAGEDPANEVTTLGLLPDDLVLDLAGVHVDEMAVNWENPDHGPVLRAIVQIAGHEPATSARSSRSPP